MRRRDENPATQSALNKLGQTGTTTLSEVLRVSTADN